MALLLPRQPEPAGGGEEYTVINKPGRELHASGDDGEMVDNVLYDSMDRPVEMVQNDLYDVV